MKKLISFLLVVTLFTCGIFICPNETIKAVYASADYYTIEYDDSLAYTPLEYDPDIEYTAEELSYDCLRYYGLATYEEWKYRYIVFTGSLRRGKL